MSDTDLQLLTRYTRDRAEDAFAELVRRHVDLVHSAALRQVRSQQLAEEVAQSAFTDLARNAAKLTNATGGSPVLIAWLYQVTRRTAIDVVRREARRQLREQIATEMNAMNATTADWTHIEPLLDEAMSALDETDRAAVLLRYFENKSLREVGATLGTSDDAAQKRVSRAVERLREFFVKRGVTIGASGVVVVISANAVQAAPVGLAVAISTAAAMTGTTIASAATTTAVKTIAMTTLQKTIVGATLAAAVGTGIYEARQVSQLREKNQTLQQQQAPLAEQIQQLQQERDEATNQLVQLREEVERLNPNGSELLRLRAEVARLRGASAGLADPKAGGANSPAGERTGGSASQLTQEGLQLWQSGRPTEAIPKFESALKLDPNNSIAWNGLGWASFNSGRTAEGEQAFLKLIELEPEHPAALNGLGQIYLSQKKYAEAEPYFLKAGPKAPAAWYGLARLYLLQDKFDQAEKWAQMIIDSGQGNESTRAMLKAAKDKKVSDALRLMIEPQ